MSSIIGKNIKISIFGQSHSPAIGVTIDGMPAGVHLDMEEILTFMSRRAPGNASFATKRKEPDVPEFVSGLVNHTTCGAPITALIRNTNTRSDDYAKQISIPRPSHADYPAQMKFKGFQDVAGGGHFSGRLTAPLCLAGAIAMQVLLSKNIRVFAHIASIHDVKDTPFSLTCPQMVEKNAFPVINKAVKEEMMDRIEKTRMQCDSVGGTIECAITGLPAGIGNPMFYGLENRISQIVFGIPAIKGIEFGNGFDATLLYGSENNDAYLLKDGCVETETNRHGGILGGISTGMPVVFRVAIKPTPSISKTQNSINLDTMEETELNIVGRHDPCIVPRAVPCVESAAAIAVLDALYDIELS